MREFWISKHYFDAPRKMVFDSPPDTDLPVDHVISYDAFDSLLKDAQELVEALSLSVNAYDKGNFIDHQYAKQALQSFKEKWPSKIEKIHGAIKDMDGKKTWK